MKPAKIFTDKMVLQREKPIYVWGNAEPGELITVTLDKNKNAAVTDENGNWMVKLPPSHTARNLTMIVSGAKMSTVLHDICVGEVWIAGGQSNMEYLLGFDARFDMRVKDFESNTDIRYFNIPQAAYPGAEEAFDFSKEDFWMDCRDPYFGGMSAVGYYFAKKIYEEEPVPIGIVGCNWGGTPACAWMDPKRLADNEGQVWLQDYENQTKDMDMEAFLSNFPKRKENNRSGRLNSKTEQSLVKTGFPWKRQKAVLSLMGKMGGVPMFNYERRPGGLYESMLKKIAPYSARGVIWYQGETDGDNHAAAYSTVFGEMIANWRELWHEELPFLFVQLAPFYRWLSCEGKNYSIIREQQEKVSLEVPNTWMASIGDAGMEYDIHPKNKKPVGDRLALLALQHVYQKNVQADAPRLTDITRQGNDVILTFANGDGLKVLPPITGSIQDAFDPRWEKNVKSSYKGIHAMQLLTQLPEQDTMTEEERAEKLIPRWKKVPKLTDFTIEENHLILHQVPEEIHYICFAKTDYYEINLYNRYGIPAIPFEAGPF